MNVARSTLILLAVLLAAPAAASAQDPAAGDFGGGTLVANPVRNAVGVTTIAARVADGRVRVQAYVSGRCALAKLRRTVPITPAGDFSVTARGGHRSEEDGFRHAHRTVIRGRITAEGGEGTVSSRLVGRERKGRARRCRTGTLRWTVRPGAGAGQGNPVAAPAGATLFGVSSQRDGGLVQPVLFRVSADGQRLAAGLYGFAAPCRRDAVKWDYRSLALNIVKPVAIAPDGSFRSVERYRRKYTDAIERMTITFAGRFTEGGAQGTLSLTSRFTRRNGRFFDRCSTGEHTWVARP